MKYLIQLLIFSLLSTLLWGQKKNKKETKLKSCAGVTLTTQFQIGDSLITCNTCHWDECGNIVDNNSDTIYKNTGVVYPGFKPIFLTTDSILLTKKLVAILLDKSKIRHMQFLHCNEVAKRMGFIALEGLYFVDLRDTTLTTTTLLDAVKSKFPHKNISTTQILINGYHINTHRIKHPKSYEIEIVYLDKSNNYCVLTE